ncbi:MAG: TM2 domain-containing protein, partial [Acidobacteriales bacterium]|nr:TM2 domain-containing protein [Terriglobales bacterium]
HRFARNDSGAGPVRLRRHTELVVASRKRRVARMAANPNTHSVFLGYVLWIFGFLGAHRFYFGKPISGIIWFFTIGLLFIGWIVDLFLIPSMDRQAQRRFIPGPIDYTIGWLLLWFLGFLGIHRFYLGKWGTGIIYLLTAGLLGIGWLYDLCTLNTQISERNVQRLY